MTPRAALAIVTKELASQKPDVVQVDTFLDLPEDILAELRDILGPCQAAGLIIEKDPTVPSTYGVLVENRLFRVSVVTNPQTGGMRVAILGPTLEPWDKETFHALVPDPVDAPEPEPLRITERPPTPDQRELLAAILEELKQIKAALSK